MKKWAIWKTICVVIASILFVSGISVLGVYLAGGFKEKKVAPNTIFFEDIDEKLYNPDTEQYEVTDSFYMIVNGQSSGGDSLTEKRVELSLDGGNYYIQTLTDENGVESEQERVRNSVLSVPRFCTIGQAFEVRVQKSVLQKNDKIVFDSNGSPVFWTNGGISTITATINNCFANARIAVDTPVYSIEATAVDLDGNPIGGNANEITLNDRFTLKTTFFPENSAYLFNDQNNEKITTPRKRLEFFDPAPDKDNIDVLFDEERAQIYFEAEQISEDNLIHAYAFTNAQTQLDMYANLFAENGQNVEDTYRDLAKSLASGDIGVEAEFVFNIVKASVGSFEISQSGTTWESLIGRDFDITMKKSEYANAFLGAKITSTDGNDLPSMMKNIALAFEFLDGDRWVNAGDKIIIKNGQKVEGFTDDAGREYYFADTNPPNPSYALWRINANVEQESSFRITAVLLLESPEGGWQQFHSETEQDIYTIGFKAMLNVDKPVSWANDKDIEQVLEYNGANNITPWTCDLSDRASIPAENEYKTIRFFAAFKNTPEDQIKRILGKAGDQTENPYIGNYMVGTQLLRLYPLDSSGLIIYDVGEFDLYFATIRTSDDGGNILVGGLYDIIQMVDHPIHVKITKSLYSGSITGLKSRTTVQQNHGGNYYFFNGAPDTISLTFGVEDDSWDVVMAKIADGMFSLRLFDERGEITNYFDITPMPQTDAAAHTFTYTLSIKSAFADTDDHSLSKITLKDDGNDKLQEWEYVYGDLGWSFEGVQGRYILYTPKIVEVGLTPDPSLDFDASQPIEITQSLTPNGNLETKIRYYSATEQSYKDYFNGLDQFMLQFSKTVYDQHGNTAILSQRWRYATSDRQLITILGGGQSISFPTTQGTQTAELWIVGSTDSSIESNLKLKFQITATGIDSVKYDSTLDHDKPGALSDGDLSQTIKIAKYGASKTGGNDNFDGGEIDFANLVELYIGNETFSKFNFKFSIDYLYSLPDEDVLALFGADGMLELAGFDANNEVWSLDGDSASTIRQSLSELRVRSLTFKHNFMIDGTVLKFEIVDSQDDGIINIPMDFTILSNFSAIGDGQEVEFYATQTKHLTGMQIQYKNHQSGAAQPLDIDKLLPVGQYIVDEDDDSTYKFVVPKDDSAKGVGTVTEDGLKFGEVWTDSPMQYKIVFYPDGENKYAPFYIITVNVHKNFKFKIRENARYTFVGNADAGLEKYIEWGRIEEGDELGEITFEIDDNPYIEVVGKTFNPTGTPIFQWGQEYLTYTVAATIKGADGKTTITIGECEMKFYSGVTPQDVAARLSTTNSQNYSAETPPSVFAQTETIDNVTYLKVTNQPWWAYNSQRFGKLEGYNLEVKEKSVGQGQGTVKTTPYDSTKTGDDFRIQFQTSAGLYGIGNSNCCLYVIVKTSAGEPVVEIDFPLIVSQVGLINGIYGKEDGTTTLASLEDLRSTNADQLINEGKYLEVTAGQSNLVVARPYSELFTSVSGREPGIYWLRNEKNANTIKLNVLSTLNVKQVNGRLETSPASDNTLVTVIPDADKEGNRSVKIKHLVGDSSRPEDVQYVVLQVVVTSSGSDLATFNYILKINPDATIGETVYPYADDAEYIKTDINEPLTVDLDEQFGQTVREKSKNQYRFNMKVFDLLVDNSECNVEHSYVATNSQGAVVDKDELKVEFDDRHMIVTPTKNGTYTIVVTRTYTDFVGAQIEYKFILNDLGSSYTLKFEKVGTGDIPTQDTQDPTLYNLTLNKTSEENKNFDLIVKFVDTTGGVESPVPGKLEMHGDKHLKAGKPTEEDELYGTFEYNNKATADGNLAANTLRIYFVDYLDRDQEADLYIYSMYGFLARVHITFSGNVTLETNSLVLNAGSAQKIDDLLKTVKLYGGQKYDYFESPLAPTYAQATPEEEAAHENDKKYYYGISGAQVLQVKALADGEDLRDLVYFPDSSVVLVRPSIENASTKIQITIWLTEILEWQTTNESGVQLSFRSVGKPYSYTFNLDLTITPNIKNKEDDSLVSSKEGEIKTIVREGDVTAKEVISGIELKDLFNVGSETRDTIVEYKWEALSGGNAVVSSSSYKNAISIQTNYVPWSTTASVRITVGLRKDKNSPYYQEFSVIYQFTIVPDVTVNVNYPKPTQDGDGLKLEYVKADDTLTASDIVNGTAPFADATRFVVKNKKNNQTVLGNADMTLQIVGLENASVYNEAEKKYYSQDGSDSYISISDFTILTFKKGTWNGSSYQDNGEKPKVTFRLTYHTVFDEYTFEIVDKLYDISFNKVHTDTAGSVETFYVDDLTGSRNIFANGRILSFNVAQTAEKHLSSNSTIYVVLEKKTTAEQDSYTYTCKGISLSAADIGRNINIDLGNSFSRVVGVYLNEIDTPRDSRDSAWTPSDSDQDITKDLFGDSLKLTSRVKLNYYDIEVDYSKFSSDLEIDGELPENFAISKETLNDIDQNNQVTLDYKGSSATAPYTYKLDVDFAVARRLDFQFDADGKVTGLSNVQETTINVSQTIKLVDSFEVYKPSVGTTRLITKKDIDGDHKIELEVIGLNSQVLFGNFGGLLFWDSNREDLDKLNAIYNYPGTINNPYPYTDIFTPYKDNIENAYLTISPNQDEELNAYDYDIHAYGAKNLGNYVAFRLTYTVDIQDVGKITKDFYMIVKVVPDYTITYQRASGVEMDELGIYSNDGDNEIFQLHLADGKTDQYESVSVAGGSNSIVQARHNNSTTAPGDRAAQNFTYTLTYDDGNGTYNNQNNVNAKLVNSGNGPFATGGNSHWEQLGSTGLQWTPAGANSQISLNGAGVVKFGTQKYRLRAEDAFGYVFYVCFQLNGTGETPTLASNAQLTEDNYFDVGVEYNSLSIEPPAKEGEKATVSGGGGEMKQPQGTGVDALVLQNLSAWGFKQNPSDYDDKDKSLFDDNATTWREAAEKGGKFNDADLKYFDVLDLTKLRVIGIDFYPTDEEKETIESLNPAEDGKGSIIKTDKNLHMIGEGKEEAQYAADLAQTFKVPRFPSTVYGEGTEAQIDIVIRFGYNWQESKFEEYYNLRSTITVRRNISITSTKKMVVRDGVEFNAIDNISVTKVEQTGGSTTNTLVTNFSIYDDTIEIIVPAHQTVRYTIQAAKDFDTETPLEETTFAKNESGETIKVYASLSDILHTTLSKEHKFKILENAGESQTSKWPDGTQFAYYGQQPTKTDSVIINSNNADTLQPISIGKIGKEGTSDTIKLENAQLLSGDNRIDDFAQYYLISVPTGGGESVEYRHTQYYTVTGHYYSLAYNYTADRKFVTDYLTVKNGEETQYVIPVEAWANELQLQVLGINENGVEEVNPIGDITSDLVYNDNPENPNGYLKFECQVINNGGGTGQIVMDENGTITTLPGFNINSHHIKVTIKQRVSDPIGSGDEIEFAPLNDVNAMEREFIFSLSAQKETDQIDISQLVKEKKIDFVGKYLSEDGAAGTYKKSSVSLPADLEIKDTTQISAVAKPSRLFEGMPANFADNKLTATLKIDGADKNFMFDGKSDDVEEKYYLFQKEQPLYKRTTTDGTPGQIAADMADDSQNKTTADYKIEKSKLETYNAATTSGLIVCQDGKIYIKIEALTANGTEYFIDSGVTVSGGPEFSDDDYKKAFESAKFSVDPDTFVLAHDINELKVAKEFTNYGYASVEAINVAGYTVIKTGAGYYFLAKEVDGNYQLYTILSNFAFSVGAGA